MQNLRTHAEAQFHAQRLGAGGRAGEGGMSMSGRSGNRFRGRDGREKAE